MPIGLFRSLFFPMTLFAAVSFGQSLEAGKPAPPLLLKLTIPAGRSATWDALRGKPVVLEFWATWCASCVAEIPHLNELTSRFEGVQFIAITDEPLSVVEPFLAKRAIQGWVGLDEGGATFKAYGVEARPQTIFVDKEGVVRGILHPEQVDAAVLTDFVAGRPIKPYSLPARLHMLEDATADPVFAVMLRPSNRAKPGGVFAQDPGKIQGDNIPLKNVIAYAYSVGARHLEGPEPLLNAHYDFCVLLPGGATGDTDLLRDMLERSFKLKIRREPRQVDAAVLKISGPKPAEFAGSLPISTLVGILESRLNRFVLNETGLDGRYKFFELPEKEEDLRNSLRSELGIEMSFERRSVDILVIDSMELPTYRVSLPGR